MSIIVNTQQATGVVLARVTRSEPTICDSLLFSEVLYGDCENLLVLRRLNNACSPLVLTRELATVACIVVDS